MEIQLVLKSHEQGASDKSFSTCDFFC